MQQRLPFMGVLMAILITSGGACSHMAMAAPATTKPANERFPDVPGEVIAHIPAKTGIYIGSPGILKLGDGTLLAKHDEFGPRSSEHRSAVTRLYRSTDFGLTWSPLAKVDGLFWSNIFEHAGAVYMIGVQKHHGPIVVMKSADGGKTWSKPTDGRNGLIRAGEWHTAPMQLVEHAGRFWRSVESADSSDQWGDRYRARVMSIAVDGDLLDASQWTISDTLERDGKWLGREFKFVLEGNLVIDRDGKIRNILRTELYGVAAVATCSPDGKTLSADPAFDRAMFPGTNKKFTIRWDEPSQLYWMLANPVSERDAGPDMGGRRNQLTLFNSADLRTWSERCVLLYHPDPERHAFQYPDFIIDGNDMLIASRTAYDDGLGGAPRGHDANFLTFHRVADFRDLKPTDGVTLPERERVELKAGPFEISGFGFEKSTLVEGGRAFTNRDYVWTNVPAELQGAVVTSGPGGFSGRVEVQASRPASLLIMTSTDIAKMEMPAAFTRRSDLTFAYNDRDQTRMAVYERPMKAGERLVLPTGNWTGCHVLFKEQ